MGLKSASLQPVVFQFVRSAENANEFNIILVSFVFPHGRIKSVLGEMKLHRSGIWKVWEERLKESSPRARAMRI